MKITWIKSLAVMTTFFAINLCFAQQGPPPGQDGEKKNPPSFKELLVKMDANKDGQLSKIEVKGPLSEKFEKVDANKDGFLTEEEMKNAPKSQGPPPSKN